MTIGRDGVHEIVVARAGRLVFLSTMRAMAVERINDLPLAATFTYLSRREVFPRSSVDCRCASGKSRNHPSGRGAALEHGRHAHSSEKSHWPGLERLAKEIARSFEPNVRWMPVCTICAPRKNSAMKPARSMSVTGNSIR
jgi:hypothetical protein